MLRDLDDLQAQYHGLMRIRRRYFPVSRTDLDGWEKVITAVEMARSLGRYEAAHRLMVEDDGVSWEDKVSNLADLIDIDAGEIDEAILEERFGQQLAKDLTAGPEQYGVTASPYLMINGTAFVAEYSPDAIRSRIEEIILEAAI